MPPTNLRRQFLLEQIHSVLPSAAIFTVVPGFVQPFVCDTVEQAQSFDSRESSPESIEQPTTAVSSPNSISMVAQDSSQEFTNVDLPLLLTSPSTLKEHISQDLFNSIKVTQSAADKLYLETMEQSSSKLWYDHRAGLITASNMHKVLKYTGRRYPLSIIKSIMQYYKISGNVPSLKWGREKEATAIEQYCREMMKTHEDFKVSSCGLIIDPKYPYLGASPDGLGSCSCCGDRLLEIKCPYKHRNLKPEDIVDSKFFLQYNDQNELQLSRDHEYYTQVQGQLYLSHHSRCDFVCWTTAGFYIETVHVDDLFKAKLMPKLEYFFKKYVVPELVCRAHDPTVSCCNVASDKDEAVYCFCREPEHGSMILCDGRNCQYKWFHFDCVDLSTIHNGDWFCKECMAKDD